MDMGSSHNLDFYADSPRDRQLVATDSSPIEFELKEKLSDSTRGFGGFGSTGK